MRRGRARFKLCVKAPEDLDELSSAQWLELVVVLYDIPGKFGHFPGVVACIGRLVPLGRRRDPFV